MHRFWTELRGRVWLTPQQRQWLMLAAIPLLSLPAWWPLMIASFPRTHDASVHVIRFFLVAEQFAAGAWFPRWLPDLFLGYGYPVLNFYAPGVYFAAGLLHSLGLDYLPAFAALVVLAIIVAGWGMYLLALTIYGSAHERGREWTALATALAYMYASYFLVNIYTRGALAEVMAQALLPLIFLVVYRLLSGQRPLFYAVATTLLFAGIVLTHNITLLFLLPLLVTYVLVIVWQQQRKGEFQQKRLLWLAGASLAALVMSAFFWLPVLFERQYLGPSTFDTVHELPVQLWNWRTFVETNWPFDYEHSGIPFRLGLAQLLLASLGLFVTRQRSPLWWYWIAWGAVCIFCITPLSIPVWTASSYLQLAQFPWRLLTIVCLALAIATGGIVTSYDRTWQRIIAVAAIFVVLVWGNVPQRNPYTSSVYADVEVNPAVIAHYETVRSAFGAGWHREFLPRWAVLFDEANTSWPDDTAPSMQVRLVDVAPTMLTVATESSAAGALRLNQFYFPGWEAQLDGGELLPVEPTTNRGVVTVTVPAGAHTVRFRWAESTVQRVAEWITILGLFAGAFALWVCRQRWLGGIVLALGLVAGVVLLRTPTAASTPFVPANVEVAPGLRLLGYHVEQVADGRQLLVTPYWHVNAPLPPMKLRWSLVDDQGSALSSAETLAYYDSIPFPALSPGSIMRDGYRLELPWSQPARSYMLQVQPVRDDEPALTATTVGSVAVAPTPNIIPLQLLLTDPRSGAQAWLDGYRLTINGTPVAAANGGQAQRPPVVHPGDEIDYVLYWRANGQLPKEYHSFMHVVNAQRQSLVSLDKVPGTDLWRPLQWDKSHTERDTFSFRIPTNAVSGVVYPRIGLYDFDVQERFSIQSQDGKAIGDAFDLPALKIVNQMPARPKVKLAASYDDFAELLGYDLVTPDAGVEPGAAITLTVYYRSRSAAPADYTQFFQLYDPGLGMAAQLDQPPLAGANPTSTWAPGEVIADQVVLTVRPDAAAGRYTLNTGFYNPNDGGTRVGVSRADGARYADDQVSLFQVQIEPAQR